MFAAFHAYMVGRDGAGVADGQRWAEHPGTTRPGNSWSPSTQAGWRPPIGPASSATWPPAPLGSRACHGVLKDGIRCLIHTHHVYLFNHRPRCSNAWTPTETPPNGIATPYLPKRNSGRA